MAENNSSNTSATSSAANAKRRIIIPVAVILVLVVVFLALFFGSVSLYRKAAEKGNKEALFTYGMHYRYGLGVRKDTVEAWELWRKAAKQDLKAAQNKLTEIHKDIEKAANAEKADARIQLLWAECLANGWGPKQDDAAAFVWFKKAADNGNAEAKAIVEQKEKEEAERQQRLKAAEEKKAAEELKKAEEQTPAAEEQKKAEEQTPAAGAGEVTDAPADEQPAEKEPAAAEQIENNN